MRALGAAELLRLWEAEERARPAERAMVLLEAAADADEAEALGSLTIGARDARLLELRARTFGEILQARTRCPACGSEQELALAVSDLLAPRAHEVDLDGGWQMLDASDWRVRFRLPCALDLVEIGEATRPLDLRRALLERCVDAVERDGSPASSADLPEEVISAIASRMEELDPCADILLALSCGDCGSPWQAPFDIAAYLWAEFGVHAPRLLSEVDALARAYGWREMDILAMSSRRRRAYLELAGA